MAKHDEFDDEFGFGDDDFEFTDGDDEEEYEDDEGFDDGSGPLTGEEDFTPEFDGRASTPGPEYEAQKKGFKKTGLIVCGVALIVVIFAVVLMSAVSSKKANPTQTQTTTQEMKANPNEVVTLPGSQQQQTQAQQEQPTQTAQTQIVEKDPYDWQEVTLTTDDTNFGDTMLDGTFTVTDVKIYARKTDTTANNLQLKGVLTGSISGLPGTYTLELPADTAVQVKVGMSFTIQYQLRDMNGSKIVGNILY